MSAQQGSLWAPVMPAAQGARGSNVRVLPAELLMHVHLSVISPHGKLPGKGAGR